MRQLQQELKLLFDVTHNKQNASKSDLMALYRRLISEEYKEFIEEDDGSVKAFKELLDLIWVCIQYANAAGYDLDAGMKLLIKEYESKFRTKEGEFKPIFREDGKLLKNTGFKKLDLTKLGEAIYDINE